MRKFKRNLSRYIEKIKKFILSRRRQLIPFSIVLTILLLSVGYSAFVSEMNLSKTLAHVRIQKDIRVTGVSEVQEKTLSDVCTLVNDADDNGTISVGDEYSCDPGDGIYRTFYVLEDGDNTTLTKGDTGTTGAGEVSLIMNENMSSVAVNIGEAETYLKEQTKEWADVDVNLPSAYQIAHAALFPDWNESDVSELTLAMATWLSGEYFTSTYPGILWYVKQDVLSYDNSYSGALHYYVRPVITLKKETTSGTTYTEYNVSSVMAGANLPNENSSIILDVTVTNIGNAEVGIKDITGLPDNLTYEILNYNLKDKICDETGKCSLGVSQDIRIRIKYKDGGYDSSKTFYDINLDFDFQQFYSVTYTDIKGAIGEPCTLVSDTDGSDSITSGDQYSCEVKPGTSYTFYVLNVDGTNVNLMLDHNINNDGTLATERIEPNEDYSNVYNVTAYVTKDDYLADGGTEKEWNLGETACNTEYGSGCEGAGNNNRGPLTALKFLKTATSSWINLKESQITMPTAEQIAIADGQTFNQNSISVTANWLTLNTLDANDNSLRYMTSTGHSSYPLHAWFMNPYGTLAYGGSPNDTFVSHPTYAGVRPVITLSTIANWPKEVLGGDTLTVDFKASAPGAVEIKIEDKTVTDFIYSDGILTLANVNGNVEILKAFKPIPLITYLQELYTPNSTAINNGITYNLDTTNNLMNDRLGGTTTDYNGGNIRYYGSSPNNYIDIGDRDSNGNIIYWRIIGLFDTKYATDELPCNVDSDSDGHYDNCATEKLVKIIRSLPIGPYSWDYTSSGSYFNDWSKATLKTMLNDAYYNSTTTSYYNGSTTLITVDFSSNGLSPNPREYVENVLWNLGGFSTSSSDSNYYQNLYPSDAYKFERGTIVYNGRLTEWVGKVALMYPSDFGYATDFGLCNQKIYNYNNDLCNSNDWINRSIYVQTLTPQSDTVQGIYFFTDAGVLGRAYASNSLQMAPTLYLKSDLLLKAEYTGTSTDPYVVTK